jgi:hypothetical protein
MNTDDSQYEFHFVSPSKKGKTIQEKFEIFNFDNPWVYEGFVSMARKAKERGRNKIGMKLLTEVMRWDYYMHTTDANSDFKLCNNYTSRYSRLIEQQEPDLKGFFTMRELQAK